MADKKQNDNPPSELTLLLDNPLTVTEIRLAIKALSIKVDALYVREIQTITHQNLLNNTMLDTQFAIRKLMKMVSKMDKSVQETLDAIQTKK